MLPIPARGRGPPPTPIDAPTMAVVPALTGQPEGADTPSPQGRPIAGQGVGLPIAARGLVMPIAARGADAPASGLPIVGRGAGLAMPIAARGTDAPVPQQRVRIGDPEEPEAAGRRLTHITHQAARPRAFTRRGSMKVVRGRQLLDDYCLGEILGEGAFSIVHACYTKEGEFAEYAVKMVDKVESPMEAIKQEVNLLDSLKHPNIVNFIEVFWEKCFVCIVLERYRGGDLFVGMQSHWDTRGKIPCDQVIHVKRQIVNAVRFLHQQGVVHRDVKGDNYLLDREDILDRDCKVTLTDFGTACRLEEGVRLSQQVGTRTYWSPEFFKLDYGSKVDDWAVGIVICGLLTAAFPFNSEAATQDPDRPAKIAGALPPLCLDMVQKLLEKDEMKRMTSAEAADHPWMAEEQNLTSETTSLSALDFSSTYSQVPPVTREEGPDHVIHERRIILRERLETQDAIERAAEGASGEMPASRRLTRVATAVAPVDKLNQARFVVVDRKAKKQFGYEWWSSDVACGCVRGVRPRSKTFSGQVLRIGDNVCIIKEGKTMGKTGIVVNPHWHGLVKVELDVPDDMDKRTACQPDDVVLIATPIAAIGKPDKEPIFKNDDFVRVVTEGEMKGQLAEVIGLSSSGMVKVRMKEPNVDVGEHEYAAGDLEHFQENLGEEMGKTFSKPILDTNTQIVGQMLEDHGIDTTVFGTGQSKSLQQFAEEVHTGAVQLMLDATEHRTLVRVVNVVLLRISLECADGETRYLIERSEKFLDGRERTHSRLPGSKKEPHENARKVAARITKEVLNMTDCRIDFDFERTEGFEEEGDSTSYPGVRTVYRKEIVEGYVTTERSSILKRIGAEKRKGSKYGYEDAHGNTKFFSWLTGEECEEIEAPICAPTGWEVSCLVNAPVGFSEERLRRLLSSSGVDLKSFGTQPRSKTLKDLLDEIRRGETSFVMEPDGWVLRVVDVVVLKVSKAGGKEILVKVDEASTDDPDKKRVLNRLPGAMLRPADNKFVRAYDMIKTTLNIDENSVNLHPETVELIESAELSNSYPELLTLYRQCIISGEVVLPDDTPEPPSP